jgi:hypothetical protein
MRAFNRLHCKVFLSTEIELPSNAFTIEPELIEFSSCTLPSDADHAIKFVT